MQPSSIFKTDRHKDENNIPIKLKCVIYNHWTCQWERKDDLVAKDHSLSHTWVQSPSFPARPNSQQKKDTPQVLERIWTLLQVLGQPSPADGLFQTPHSHLYLLQNSNPFKHNDTTPLTACPVSPSNTDTSSWLRSLYSKTESSL